MNKKKENKIEVEITEKMTTTFKDIKKYLWVRLACDIRLPLEQATKVPNCKPDGNSRINFILESPSIKSNDTSIGLFRFIIKEFHVKVEGTYNISDDSWVAEIGYRYTHYDGSSNGHNLNFRLKGHFYRGDHDMVETE